MFEYSESKGLPILIPPNDLISVSTEKSNDISEINLDGDYKEYFECHQEEDNVTLTVTLKDKPLPFDVVGPIALTLSLKTDKTASAAIIISVEHEATADEDVPVFLESYYVLTYTEKDDIPNLTPPATTISVVTKKPQDIEDITLTGDYNEYFQCMQESDNITFTIALKDKPLPSDVVTAVVLTLSLRTDHVANTTIIVSVEIKTEEDVPVFSKASYMFTYSESGGLPILTPPTDVIFVVTEKPNEISDISLEGDYKEYFEYHQEEDNVTFSVNLKEILLPFDVVGPIALTLSLKTDKTANAAIIISVKHEAPTDEDVPVFSEPYYVLFYNETNDNPALTLASSTISVVTRKPQNIEDITLTGDYNEYFQCKQESDNITFTIALKDKLLPSDVVTAVVLTLSLRTDHVANTTIIVSVETKTEEDVPVFSKASYIFTYSESGGLPILTPPTDVIYVVTEKPNEISDISLEGDYAKYFEWHQGDDNITFTITLKDEPLPETTASPVVLTLSLKTDNVARVVILVSIENATALDIDVPVFSKAFYTLTYSLSTEVITSSDTISLVTEKPSDISEIRLEGEYEDYFIVTHAEDAKTFEISVKDEKQLPSNAPSPVLLTLSVQTDRAASVAIVIAIDESTEVVVDVPVFTRSFYSFNYSEKSLAPHDGPIYVVTKKPDSVTDVQIDGDYAKYFSYKQGENETSFILTLEVDLPSDVESPITLTFSVTTDTTARVILIVFVGNDSPEVDIDIPRFSRSYYSFTYTENDGKALLASNDGDVTVTTQKPDSVSDVKLLGDYREYFAIKVDKTTITLTVSRTLPNNTPTPVILMLTLKTDVETSVNFIVNIKNEDSTPQFSSPYFIGTYNSTTKQIDMDDKIEITGNPTLKISEDSGCSSYFDLVKDGTGYRLTVTKALPSDVLEQSSLVLVVVARLNGKDVAFATVVINLPVESMLPPSESDDKSSTITAYMITVIVLCIVLTSIIVAMILLWYFKIRNTSYVELEETSSGNTNFGKKNSNVNIDDVIRRPTGYPFGPHGDATYTVSGEETANEYDIPNDPELNKGKRVAFDNVVQSIDVDVDRELSEGGNNLPRRRPTGFVFNPPPPEEDTVSVDNPIYKSEYEIPIDAGQNNILYAEADSDRLSKIDASSNGLTFGYPMEEGLYETSDSLGIDKERKKSVAFDDRIERMQIDAVKDDEDEISDSENLDRAI
ncbi:uncharacterized protein LOC132697214 isoform X1 [Cylas formicarius]|uniref:uncharacterized protein LOC132697214 isoform X1 n=1 Tax=Cylas formicarius TaxID=197179 RepID=UPI0029587C59|nr:uncharacterized protein LOC132697214 isoform X1 [Cylas formicarius]